MLGVTGTKSIVSTKVAEAVARIRRSTKLPVAVGFGIKTPEDAAAIARDADAAVVGSALVQQVVEAGPGDAASRVHGLVRELSKAVRTARQKQSA